MVKKIIEKIKEIAINIRKNYFFWLIYAGATVLATLILVLLLVRFNHFLEAYEATRPVHEADKVVESYFKEDYRENLKKVLTNKVDNGIESIDEVLDRFYTTIDGKEISYGRFMGHYSDDKPQYIVTANGEQIAYFSLKETSRYSAGFSFKLWEIESVTLTVQAKYSYAVTIPDTMTLYVDGVVVPDTEAKAHKGSDCEIGYYEYAGAGFYFLPEIKVIDRVGQEVVLERDEASGGYYYLIHYAYAPSDTVVSFNGHELTSEQVMESDIEPDVDFFMVQEVLSKYPEYNSLVEEVKYPTFTKYYVDIYASEEGNSWTNRLDTKSQVTYDSQTRTFSAGIVSDDSNKESLVEYATSFLETYSLFCSKDKKITDIKSFFPEDSAYYEKISYLNNSPFASHSNVQFQNHEVKEYVGYSDKLVYVHVYLEQRMKLKSSGNWVSYPVDLPLWLVKIEDKWYVAGMDFDNFMNGYTFDE